MKMEKLNKHGLPIMNVNKRVHKKVIENPYFCEGVVEECNNKAENKYKGHSYCDECYSGIVGYSINILGFE